MKLNLFTFLCLVIVTALTGCNSVKRDDFVVSTELSKSNLISEENFKFYLDPTLPVDVRGIYSHNRTIGGSEQTALYYGDAVMVLTQVLTHAAMNSSAMESKLKKQQQQANEKVKPLLSVVGQAKTETLLAEQSQWQSEMPEVGSNVVQVKPIFFSNQEMNRLSLKLVSWIDKKPTKYNKKDTKKYQNIIEIHERQLPEDVVNKIKLGQIDITPYLKKLFNQALDTLKKDVAGAYAEKMKQKTFHILSGNKKVFVRGSIVEQSCDFVVLKNLRDWIIKYPADDLVNLENNCNS